MLKEALRYLGIQGEADANTLRLVSECMDRVRFVAAPKWISRIFSPEEFAPYRLGEDIQNHLRGANKIFLFAATLGHGVGLEIRKAQAVDMARAAALDACAAAYIEAYCDENMPMGLPTSARFSPGYGDYPLFLQPQLLKAVGAEKIGITALDSHMLLPSKSVTAVLGLRERENMEE